MAALVQKSGILLVSAGGAGNCVFPAAVTPGNAVIVSFAQVANTKRTFAVSDGTNTYSEAIVKEHTGAARVSGVRHAFNTSGSPTNITVTPSGTCTYAAIAYEVSGLGSSPTVVTGFSEDGSSVTSHHCASSGNIDTSKSSFIVAAGAANGGLGTITEASGFTKDATGTNAILQYNVSGSAETDQRATWTSGTARDCINVIAAYETAATSVTADATFNIEWLGSASRDSTYNADWRGEVASDSVLNADWRSEVTSDTGFNIAWLGTGARDTEFVTDWRGSVSGDTVYNADWTLSVASDGTFNVDWQGTTPVGLFVVVFGLTGRARTWIANARSLTWVPLARSLVWVTHERDRRI